MLRFHIRVNTGDKNITTMYWFVHKEWATTSEEDQASQWNDAVQELNHIYQDYGRFATSVGVTKLFDKFGFERTIL